MKLLSFITIFNNKLAPALPGRLCIGAIAAMMLSAPLSKPDAPRPATARARMNNLELGAIPQSSEPNSNAPRKVRKVHYSMS